MLSRMEAEIVANAVCLKPMEAKLTDLGFELEIIHWPDPEVVTIVATTLTGCSEVEFFNRMREIAVAIDPDAILMEAGLVWAPSPIQEAGVVKRRFVSRY